MPESEVKLMPRKPKHPCSFPGCPNLVESGRRYCEEHEREENKRYERYDRDPATRKRYGRAWKRIRDSYAAAHPLCEECLKRSIYTPTEEIHHKLPLSKGCGSPVETSRSQTEKHRPSRQVRPGTHDRNNLMALCKSCHAKIHAEHGDRWHNR